MKSKALEVFLNKGKVEKVRRARKEEELNKMKNSAAYKAALMAEFRHLDVLLNNDEVDGIIVKLNDEQLVKFSEAIYSEELSPYEIEQVPGEPDQFIIRQRLI